MKPVFIDTFTATTCVGPGNQSLLAALKSGQSGLTPCEFDQVKIDTWIGKVSSVDTQENALPAALTNYECRNNRLAWLGLNQDGFLDNAKDIILRHGASRVGLFLGTSTSGIYETELAFRTITPNGSFAKSFNYSGSHSVSSLASFVRDLLGIEGPSFIISTACSSSAKVFSAAHRYIQLGLIDAAIVGGVDTLCLTTLYGFNSLQLTSKYPCKPYDATRDGISIGEAAAFCVVSNLRDHDKPHRIELIGYGESSDAYHMSSPHPEGLGAQFAMRSALRSASIDTESIDYINLHGTATPSNDKAEGYAVNAVFDNKTLCSSTKGITGHTLGAAGAVEAVVSFLALENQLIPGSVGTAQLDPMIDLNYQLGSNSSPITTVLSNSFGFGGSNCSLVFRIEK